MKVSKETQDQVDELWDAYHSLLVNDPPHEDIKFFVKGMFIRGHSVIFSTARNEKWRNHTIEWIRKHLEIPTIQYALLMRPNGDHTRSSELKPRYVIKHLDAHYKGGYYEVQKHLTVLDNSWPVIREWELQEVECMYLSRVGGRECS
jgi:hypothetical protein